MAFFRFMLVLAVAPCACVATPDLEYAPDDAAVADGTADVDAAPLPRSCIQSGLRCASPSDCCSGHCKLIGEHAKCD
jgi:hypothetical protein